MNNVNDLLLRLMQRGIRLQEENGKLKIAVPEGVATDDLLAEVTALKKDLLIHLQQQKVAKGSLAIPAAAVSADGYPLSSQQRGLYTVHAMSPDSTAYNISMALQLNGVLEIQKIDRAFHQLVEAHESLRTAFRMDNGAPRQWVEAVRDFRIEHVVCQASERDARMAAFIRPFDLTRPPLMRVGVFSTDATDHVLVIDVHHLVCDGASLAILTRDFMTLYNGQKLTTSPLPYKDYAVFQQKEMNTTAVDAARGFWNDWFAGDLPKVHLPLDHPRPLRMNFAGDTVRLQLTKEEVSALKTLSAKEGVTLYMTLLSAMLVWLYKLSGQTDLIVGTLTEGRVHSNVSGTVGMFAATLAHRGSLHTNDTFIELLQQTKHQLAVAWEHQAYRYQDLVADLALPREAGRNVLFDIMFEMSHGLPWQDTGSLAITPYHVRQDTAIFDLSLEVQEDPGQRLTILFRYATSLFERTSMERYAACYQQTLREILNDPSQSLASIFILPPSEQERILAVFNNTEISAVIPENFAEAFARTVESFPDKIAVECDSTALTYRELQSRVDAWADVLRAQGVSAGTRVAVILPRSVDTLQALLALLKLQATYIPIEREFPEARIIKIVQRSEAEFIVTDPSWTLPDETQGLWPYLKKYFITQHGEIRSQDVTTPAQVAQPLAGRAAYMIYTSGTTGEPKGAMVHEAGMMNHLWAKVGDLALTAADVVAQTASVSFDISIWQFLAALLVGGKVVIIDKRIIQLPEQFLATLQARCVTIAQLVPSLLNVFVDTVARQTKTELPCLRWMIPTGEALSVSLARKWYVAYPDIKLLNAYGPTEASDDVTHHVVPRPVQGQRTISIGRPIRNTHVYILNPDGQLCPIGIAGEICIAGVGVGLGYWRDEDKTNAVFAPNPLVGSIAQKNYDRLYRTGDYGYFTDTGTIEFLGRRDNQVKVNGNRIELQDIEENLMALPGVDEAVVMTQDDKEGGRTFLVAYYTAAAAFAISALRNDLLKRLPEYMVPSFFIHLERLPLTFNEKIDRKALPPADFSRAHHEAVPAATPLEQQMLDIWRNVLGAPVLGITDNFFSWGGDSIKAIQIASRLRQIDYRITAQDLYQYPTIQSLSQVAQKIGAPETQEHVVGRVSLTPVQRRFFESRSGFDHHYNQAVLLKLEQPVETPDLENIFGALLDHHAQLRAVFYEDDGVMVQEVKEYEGAPVIETIDLRAATDFATAVNQHATTIQASFVLATGPLVKAARFKGPDGDRLLVVIHHLLVDGMSWRILFDDLDQLLTQTHAGQALELSRPSLTYRAFTAALEAHRASSAYRQHRDYWKKQGLAAVHVLPFDFNDAADRQRDEVRETFRVDALLTEKLLQKGHLALGLSVNEILLAALLLSAGENFDIEQLTVELEGHGREELFAGQDVGRTVGWFTSIFPLQLALPKHASLAGMLKIVKEQIRSVPNKGIDYGIWRYLDPDYSPQDRDTVSPGISFNYLGQFDTDIRRSHFSIAPELSGISIHPDRRRDHAVEVTGIVYRGVLEMNLRYNRNHYTTERMSGWATAYKAVLEKIIGFCSDEATVKQYTPSDLTFPGLTIDEVDQLSRTFDFEDVYALSPMQNGMLFHRLMVPDSEAYFLQVSYSLEGHVDVAAVKSSVARLGKRHDILRTAVLSEGFAQPLQMVLRQREIEFHYHDFRKVEDAEARIAAFKARDKERNFDFVHDSLLRVTVLQRAEQAFEFVWSFHHIILDGWCIGILINEFMQLYTAALRRVEASLPSPQPYKHYIRWIAAQNDDAAKTFWKQYLDDFSEMTGMAPYTMPGDRRSSVIPLAEHTAQLDPIRTEGLRALAARLQVTQNCVLQSVWAILLSRYANSGDVLFGEVVSGRPAELPGVEQMLGLFINTLPKRLRLESSMTFVELALQAQQDFHSRAPYQHHSLAAIQQNFPGERLFDHIFIYQNFPRVDQLAENQDAGWDGFKVTHAENLDHTDYDLTVTVIPGDQMAINFCYNTAQFEAAFIRNLGAQFFNVLEAVMQQPEMALGELDMLTETDKIKLQYQFNASWCAVSKNQTFTSWFEDNAQRHESRVAVVFNDQQWTYVRLNTACNQIARVLIAEKGICPGDRVGLMVDRSEWMVICTLAILKAGGVFVPIDPLYPPDRVAHILKDSEIQYLITDQSDVQPEVTVLELEALKREGLTVIGTNLPMRTSPEDIAYILYTSGSQGKPKGVMVEHRSLVNIAAGWRSAYALDQFPVRLLQMASMAFDVYLGDLARALLNGGRLVICPAETRLVPEILYDLMQRERITIFESTPALIFPLFRYIEENGRDIAFLKLLILGSDVVHMEDFVWLREKFGNSTRILNGYGTTETTIDSCFYEDHDTFSAQCSGVVPIGKPFGNNTLYVLDREGRMAPPGAKGELYIGGPGVARGYWNNPDLTAARFVIQPQLNQRLYRTGDLARWLPSGNLLFMGRNDNQVKIRGIRIELGEIENQLGKCQGVGEVCVLRHVRNGNEFLVAYYTATGPLDDTLFANELLNYLPYYMVPHHYVRLEAIPLSPTGKVDRKALPEPDFELEDNYVAPENDDEQALAEIWSDILNIPDDRISVVRNFFELGGHSLNATILLARIAKTFSVKITLIDIFNSPTIRELAEIIGNKRWIRGAGVPEQQETLKTELTL
ncbi:non-ribosomal peptide synthase domain TIGR01720/amino acid adenylation domain-containing protein [Chryseolinea serpens]|uniref:Non-ribosomal peptide synthase domain TIGR01720/amino acid adenylation domain-containing protein n=1 Tax=Chryseolinea serpens TaxID=947013 RepID=A0A1M5XVB3_9BACT|nr:non-ribosomal peptide synthetase [Chryseolinea serpens]SHI03468.1 non-ribosomal peptide synthase domain TIGR01720/amino acid adenylation domain-containing protein [Chryseolinea serpens]